jgi:hypothetical protein
VNAQPHASLLLNAAERGEGVAISPVSMQQQQQQSEQPHGIL